MLCEIAAESEPVGTLRSEEDPHPIVNRLKINNTGAIKNLGSRNNVI